MWVAAAAYRPILLDRLVEEMLVDLTANSLRARVMSRTFLFSRSPR